MAIGSLPPVTNEIQANSGQPGKTLAQQTAGNSLLDLQAAATAEPVVAIVPETTLIDEAVAEALGHQGSLAPLYATLAELADAADLPDALKAAIDTVLALRLGQGEVTSERVAQAIRASGLFHEAVAAGKMAAVLPPAVRQALGASAPGQKQPVAARSAGATSSPTSAMVAARLGSIPSLPSSGEAASHNATTPAPTGQTYGRQGMFSASATVSGASQNMASASASGQLAALGASELAAAPTAGLATPAAGAPPATISSTGLPTAAAAHSPDDAERKTNMPPARSIAEGKPLLPPAPSVPGPGTISPPATEGSLGAPAPTLAGQPSTGEHEAHPTSQTVGGPSATVPSPAPSSAATVAAGSEGQLASGSSAPTFNVSTPPSVSAPIAASDALEVQTENKAPAISPGLPGGTVASSRAFAPWTPGRPLIPPEGAPGTPSASSLATAHPVVGQTTAHGGGETIVARPAGDKAPFVPSAVENLPAATSLSSTVRTASGPAPSGLAPGGSQQQSSHVLPSGSPTAVAQPLQGIDSAQASLQPGQAPPQSRPAPGSLEIAAPSVHQPSPQPSQAAAGVDLKGAIEVLRRELITWLGRNADVMASLDGDVNEVPASRSERPAPPRKAGPVRGQPAVVLPSHDEGESASTETLAGRALGEAERSLSRVFLHQAASAESRDVRANQTTQAFVFEVPIAGPNGTSVAQLRIERDDHAPIEPGAPPRRVFQVEIAFDIAPLGPVSVRVGLMDGRRVAVGVWCESDDGLVRMEAERENIVLGLEQEGMVVAGVDLHRGHPPEGREETAVAANHRLDLQL